MQTLDSVNNYWNKQYEYLWDKKFFFKNQPKYSEHGEDRIIEMIFNKIKPVNKWFVDVGCAYKGSSNTWSLIEKDWSGLLIDADENPINEVRGLIRENNKVRALNTFITPNNLDKVLYDQNVPEVIDFLSIDTDSYEYEIWKNLEKFKPNMVCIEVNQGNIGDFKTIDYDPSASLYKYSKKRKSNWNGATTGLMNKLAEEKGYDYLCWIVSNVFYIKRSFINAS